MKHAVVHRAGFLGIALFAGLSLLACTGTTVQTPGQHAGKEIQLAHEKYQLKNGLTVILHKDDSDPLVHVDVTYHVGSAREVPGRSGFAHFFEHMMFQGSKHIADEDHFRIITEAGGELNGTTNSDRTNYFQTVPANQLERVLWLESDRMGFLLEAVTQEKFEIQRETVKNERAELFDNQPYGLRSERIAQALYPPEHPYSWPTIGFVEDLDRVDVNDLRQFFLRWYGPNNAVLSVGGNFDIEQTKALIEKYFADIPPGPEVKPAKPVPVSLAENRYITLQDNIHLPLLQLTFPTVYARHKDEAALDVLADILGGGKHSLLYKNLAESGDTVQVSATHPCRELACEFQIIALASPDMSANLAEIETKVNQTLLEFERRGVYEEDLLRAKASVEAAAVFSLQSVAGKVAVLAANETFHGNPDLVAEDLNRYLSVTKEDVMRVFTQYIKNKSSVVLSVVPQGEVELAAKEQNYVLPDRSFGIVAEQFIPSRSAKSSFDRTQMPPVGPALSVELPTYWQTRLSNGIEVMGITSHETPTVTLSIDFEGGVLLEPLEKAGLANMTAMLMNESTHNYSSAALANELAKLGSEIQISAGGRYVQIEVSSLIHKIDQTMELVEEKLLRPAFRKEEFERVKTRILQAKRQQYSDPAVLASFARNTLLFGQHNRVGLPDDGTIATIGAITLDDIKQFYARFFTSYKAQVAVVGSLDEIKATKLLSFLQDLSDAPYKVPGFKEFPQYEGQSIYIVDNGNTAQSSLLLTARALPFDATGEFFKSQLMNFSLGSAFNSRINLNLREEKGLTYGASANFIGGRNLGWYEVRADVQSDNTALAISEILQEIIMFKREGITQEELMFMRNAYSQYDALNFETPASKAYFLRRMLGFGLRPDYRQKQLAILDNMTEDSINDIAQRRLEPNALQIIVVGNKKKLASQLRALGLPIQSLELPD